MSMECFRVPFTSPSEKAGSDQRLRGRYPIALELQYKLLNKGRVEYLGVGQTLNISSGGVLFEAAGLLPSSGPVELAIERQAAERRIEST